MAGLRGSLRVVVPSTGKPAACARLARLVLGACLLAAGAAAQDGDASDAPQRLAPDPAEARRLATEATRPPDPSVDWHVTGRVLSAEGAPLGGAEVAFVPGLQVLAALGLDPWADPADHLVLLDSLVRVRTAGDGRFELRVRHPEVTEAWARLSMREDPALMRAAGRVPWLQQGIGPNTVLRPQVFVSAPGHGATMRFITAWQGRADAGDIHLVRELSLQGRVVGPDGAPLAGAAVLPMSIQPERKGAQRVPRVLPWEALATHLVARAGAEGSFELRGLPWGEPRLAAVTAAGEPLLLGPRSGQRTEGGLRDALFVGQPATATLAGRVVDARGRGVAGALVRVLPELDGLGLQGHGWPLQGPDGSLPAASGKDEAATDASGRFELRVPLLLGSPLVDLAAAAPGHPPARRDHLTPGTDDVELRLDPPAPLLLRVRSSEDGRPLLVLAGLAFLDAGGVEDAVSRPAPVLVGAAALAAAREAGVPDVPADTDPESCLLVLGVAGLQAAVQVQAAGAGTRVFWYPDLPAEGQVQDVELPAGHTLTAWVSDGISTAVPGARLALSMDWGRPPAVLSGWTDAQGWLRLHDVYATRHHVSIRAPGHVPVSGFDFSMTAEVARGTFTFPTAAAGAIAGRLHLPGDASPSGVPVTLRWKAPETVGWAPWMEEPDEVVVYAGDDGAFLATGLAHGTWTLASPAGGSAEVRLGMGELQRADLRVAGPSMLRIRLRDADGRPLSGVLAALDADGSQYARTADGRTPLQEVSGDGLLEVSLLPPSRAIVMAHLPSGVEHRSELIELEPGEVRDVDLRVPGLGELELRFVDDDGQPCPSAGLLFDGKDLAPSSRRGDVACYAGLPAGEHVLRAVAVAGAGRHAPKTGAGLGAELTVYVPERGVARDVVLVAPRPARVTLRWDRDLRDMESVHYRIGPTFAHVSSLDLARGEPPVRSVALDLLPGEHEVTVDWHAPDPGWETRTTVVIRSTRLLELPLAVASGEERVIELHLP